MGNTKRDYWAYSWHEIGRYDLPANIDYVLKTTGQQKLHYVGFSQGTTSLFVCLSQVPQYNEKIISANLLAPVASLRNIPNVGNRVLSYLYKPVKYLLEYFKIYFIDIDNKLLVDAVETVCKRTIKGGNSPICTGILYLLESKYINCVGFHIVFKAPRRRNNMICCLSVIDSTYLGACTGRNINTTILSLHAIHTHWSIQTIRL